jgi:hypothetical protein
MAVSFSTVIRNAMGDAMITQVGNGPVLRLYTAAYATLLGELVGGTPFAPATVDGQITMAMFANGIGLANGAAAIARLYKMDGVTVAMEGLTVSDTAGTGNVKLNQVGVNIVMGQNIIFDSGVIVIGNA